MPLERLIVLLLTVTVLVGSGAAALFAFAFFALALAKALGTLENPFGGNLLLSSSYVALGMPTWSGVLPLTLPYILASARAFPLAMIVPPAATVLHVSCSYGAHAVGVVGMVLATPAYDVSDGSRFGTNNGLDCWDFCTAPAAVEFCFAARFALGGAPYGLPPVYI